MPPASPATEPRSPHPALAYRAEIDGLRALAVLPVILFHAGFDWMAGGFVGVDIFFVISGYLITTIILREKAAGTFSLLRFYERRARRILPALFLVLTACLPFAWLWMTAQQLREFGLGLVAVSLFGANVLFWRTSDYFASAAEENPLLHTWSLGVEEQYYLFFPLLLLLLWPLGLRRLTLLVALLTAASLLMCEWTTGRDAIASFYLPHTRAWELLIGSLLAARFIGNPAGLLPGDRAGGMAGNGLAAAGLGLILVAMATFDRATPFPGLAALLPTVGTALIIGFGHRDTWVGSLLSRRWLVAIGLVSYSAYLWHQPLFAFARLYQPNEPDTGVLAALCLAALALAGLSWRFVEQPFRDRRRVSRRAIFGFAAAGSLALIAIGATLHLNHGFADRSGQQVRQLFEGLRHTKEDLCGKESKRDLPPAVDVCNAGDPGAPVSVAVLGDSHAEALYSELGNYFASAGRNATLLTYSGCPPVAGVYRADKDEAHRCAAYNDAVRALLDDQPAIDTVILAARWTLYMENTPFDNQEGGVEPDENQSLLAPVGDDGWRDDDAARRRLIATRVQDTVSHYLAAGKTVVVVYPVPEAGWHVPNLMARVLDRGESPAPEFSTDYRVFEARNRAANKVLDALADHPALLRIRPAALLCNTSIPGRCLLARDGKPLYFDEDHLSLEGSRLVVADIARALSERTEERHDAPADP